MGDKIPDYEHMQLASRPSVATLESSTSSSVAKIRPPSDPAASFLGPRELACLSAGLSSLYAMLLVAVYIAFAFTEQVIFPKHQDFLERTGFFVLLYAGSDLFLAYVLFFAFRAKPELVTENCKSHGSFTIRIGAVLFGAGTLVHFSLEAISLMELLPGSPCLNPVFGANVFFSVAFVVLQTYVIFVYPRLNLHIVSLIDRFGTMHVVATNVVLWLRTLVKESLHEMEETHKVHVKDEDQLGFFAEMDECDLMAKRKQLEPEDMDCRQGSYFRDLLGHTMHDMSPFLYPFVIEYALIGATVLFVMWRHVGKAPPPALTPSGSQLRKPDPARFLRESSLTGSLKGGVCGLCVLGLAIIQLSVFFGLEGHKYKVLESEAEYISKIINTLVNACGIVGVLIGLYQIQQLSLKEEDETAASASAAASGSDLDLSLIRFSVFFTFLYLVFTIITGVFNGDVRDFDFPNELHVVNGVVEAIQITLQIIFIIDLKQKKLSKKQQESGVRPGRQVAVFLFLLNLAQWVVFTFEIQKVRSSLVEARFYGFTAWTIIQRVTLPLTVFFRFHSAVVSMELWKDVYRTE